MIYMANIEGVQQLRIPASPARAGEIFALRLRDTVDGREYVVDSDDTVYLLDSLGAYVIDSTGLFITLAGGHAALTVDAIAGGYYIVSLELPAGMAEGEYEYTATVDGVTVSTGFAYLGGFTRDEVEYMALDGGYDVVEYRGGIPEGTIEYDNTVIYDQYKN